MSNKRHNRSTRAAGFTYVGLMIMLALIGVAAAATVQIGGVVQRRAAEEELLFVGLQFKQAVKSYFEKTPIGNAATAPRRLEDLVKDPRFPNTIRHLRQIYPDPLTGKTDWGLIRSTDGGILGVYSRSKDVPIRVDNFPDEFFHFKGKKTFRDWVFVYGVVCEDRGCTLPQQDDSVYYQPSGMSPR
ncbi:MAG: type II secretion system protein [Moraxellaceae bacterium]|nr:type II secretion system protein [Moraxellaceae bacterium]